MFACELAWSLYPAPISCLYLFFGVTSSRKQIFAGGSNCPVAPFLWFRTWSQTFTNATRYGILTSKKDTFFDKLEFSRNIFEVVDKAYIFIQGLRMANTTGPCVPFVASLAKTKAQSTLFPFEQLELVAAVVSVQSNPFQSRSNRGHIRD